MAKKNILIKKKNNAVWDELYPITNASNVKTAAGSDVEAELKNLYNNSMNQQRLINGNFDIWQRGVAYANPPIKLFLADRWGVEFLTDTATFPTSIIHSRCPVTNDELQNSMYYYRVNPNGAGSSITGNAYYSIRQSIENGTRLLCGVGKKVTVSFYARCNGVSNKRIGISFAQQYGSGGSPSNSESLVGKVFPLTNNWQKFSVTINTNTLAGKTFGANFDDILTLYIFYSWGTFVGNSYLNGAAVESFGGNCNIDITQIQVCQGETALEFHPKSFQQELLDCMRYYEKGNILAKLSTISSVIYGFGTTFRAIKRTSPTVGYTSNNAQFTSPVPQYFDTNGCMIFATATNTGNQQDFNITWTADAEL